MKKYYWETINGIGELYTEIELIVGNEPVLFVCVGCKPTERYLAMTYDSANGIYILRKITISELLNMLNNKSTIEQIFRKADNLIETFIDNSDAMQCKHLLSDMINSTRLPNKGVYFEIKSDYIKEYKKYLNLLLDEYTQQGVLNV